MDYEARVDDETFAFDGQVSHLTWHCALGTCRARGPHLDVSAKTCVVLGTRLGVNVASFVYGGTSLAADQLAQCREKVAAVIAQNHAAKLRDTRRTLASDEAEYELGAYTSQTATLEGGIRFVFRHGKVLLLRPNGQLFEFDHTRTIVGRGEFVEWNSRKGKYASTQVLSPAIVRRCRYASIRLEIKPHEVSALSSQMVFCTNDQEEIQLVYHPRSASIADDRAAYAAAFEAPYRDAKRWPARKALPGDPPAWARVPPRSPLSLAERRGAARAVSGSVGVMNTSDQAAVTTALTSIEGTIRSCYVEALGYLPELQGQAELYVYFGPSGSPAHAVMQRMSYVDAERFNACVEQSVLREKYAPLPDASFVIPFDLSFQ